MLSAFSSKVSISDGTGVHKCIRYEQLNLFILSFFIALFTKQLLQSSFTGNSVCRNLYLTYGKIWLIMYVHNFVHVLWVIQLECFGRHYEC